MPLRHSSIVFLLLLVLSACSRNNNPNIIFLLADDHRWDALGAAGNTIIKTPNLDKIADERDAVKAEINNNLGKGIGALSGIQDPIKEIQDMKKHGLLSPNNPFFKKDNK